MSCLHIDSLGLEPPYIWHIDVLFLSRSSCHNISVSLRRLLMTMAWNMCCGQRSCKLLMLPSELRMTILTYVLSGLQYRYGTHGSPRNTFKNFKTRVGILWTCRLLRYEGLPIFRQSLTTHWVANSDIRSMPDFIKVNTMHLIDHDERWGILNGTGMSFPGSPLSLSVPKTCFLFLKSSSKQFPIYLLY